MYTIRERLQPETAQIEEKTNKYAVVFPEERVSKFRDEQDELCYYADYDNIKFYQSDFFDKILRE